MILACQEKRVHRTPTKWINAMLSHGPEPALPLSGSITPADKYQYQMVDRQNFG
jgi:hypothetical protein